MGIRVPRPRSPALPQAYVKTQPNSLGLFLIAALVLSPISEGPRSALVSRRFQRHRAYRDFATEHDAHHQEFRTQREERGCPHGLARPGSGSSRSAKRVSSTVPGRAVGSGFHVRLAFRQTTSMVLAMGASRVSLDCGNRNRHLPFAECPALQCRAMVLGADLAVPTGSRPDAPDR
jgi:hypothetical protein